MKRRVPANRGWHRENPWYTACVEPAATQTRPATPPAPHASRAARSLHLASRSPRRRQLLDEAALDHHAEHPGFDDSDLSPGAVNATQWVAALAYLKAAAGAVQASPAATVLGADTAIVKDGSLIGTPRDHAEAFRILRTLSDGTHDVVTGVALLDRTTGRRTIFVDRASVTVGHLSDCMITAYLATGAWQGKAGGYNLRERLVDGWPLQFSGDPTTVMGLPMKALSPRLEHFNASCESASVMSAAAAKVPA